MRQNEVVFAIFERSAKLSVDFLDANESISWFDRFFFSSFFVHSRFYFANFGVVVIANIYFTVQFGHIRLFKFEMIERSNIDFLCNFHFKYDTSKKIMKTLSFGWIIPTAGVVFQVIFRKYFDFATCKFSFAILFHFELSSVDWKYLPKFLSDNWKIDIYFSHDFLDDLIFTIFAQVKWWKSENPHTLDHLAELFRVFMMECVCASLWRCVKETKNNEQNVPKRKI